MIKSIIFAFLLFFNVSILNIENDIKFNIDEFEEIGEPVYYRDLGNYHQKYNDGSVIHVDAYIVKRLNDSGVYRQFRYKYDLTLVSKSIHNGYYTQTWLYNARFYYNGNEISYNQYPKGATVYVGTAPTVAYSWFTSEEEIAKFTISWYEAAYEPRIR